MDAGVEEHRIEIVNEEEAAVEHAMRISQPGDLLLILGDNISRCWKQIIYFNSDNKESQTKSKESTRPELPGEEDFEIDMDYEIVQDERGVRIVREAGD